MSKAKEFKHLLARVEENFYREVKIKLAQKGLTMHEAIVRGIKHELEIEEDPKKLCSVQSK
ncbi:MAG: hypothetical protein WC239_02430 [Sphaerochaetaceae bacterium]|jgi:hypothetical protein